MTVLSKALEFAESVHGKDKKNGRPFLYHPLAVASLVLRYGGTPEQMVAALLHDTIGYEGVSQKRIQDLFGEKIAKYTYVFADPPLPKDAAWRTSKQAYIDKVKTLKEDEMLLVACEELHEIDELLTDMKYQGIKVWERYSVHAMEVAWYFRELASVFYASLKSQPNLVAEFANRVKTLKETVFEAKG